MTLEQVLKQKLKASVRLEWLCKEIEKQVTFYKKCKEDYAGSKYPEAAQVGCLEAGLHWVLNVVHEVRENPCDNKETFSLLD